MDDLRGSHPLPGSGVRRWHFAARIAVVKRESAAGDFQANAVSRAKKARRWLEIESPVMNFIRGVSARRKKPTRTRDADANKLRSATGTDAHQFRRAVSVSRGSGAVQRDPRRTKNSQRRSQRRARIDEHVVAELERALVELSARRRRPA